MSQTPANSWGRVIKVALALLLLAGLYEHADWRAVGLALGGLNPAYLLAAFVLFVPQTIVSATRWRRLASPLCAISLAVAVRQTLAASAWNLVTPSKLGDFSKGAMLPLSMAARAKAAGLVAIEKLLDVTALGAWWLVGYMALSLPLDSLLGVAAAIVLLVAALVPRRSPETALSIRRDLPAVAAMSLVLWALHLWQIDLFLKAAGVFVSLPLAASRVPAAIFAGLLPVSFCGLGTRDAALVWLFADVAPASIMAAVGLLTAARYLVPGALGIPLACTAVAVGGGNMEKNAGCAAFSAD